MGEVPCRELEALLSREMALADCRTALKKCYKTSANKWPEYLVYGTLMCCVLWLVSF